MDSRPHSQLLLCERKGTFRYTRNGRHSLVLELAQLLPTKSRASKTEPVSSVSPPEGNTSVDSAAAVDALVHMSRDTVAKLDEATVGNSPEAKPSSESTTVPVLQ